MKLSRKSDYALRALFTLVECRGQGPVPIRELAELNDVPRRFLEQIMLELKSIGMVRSIPGRIGGFELGRPPEQITMGQVVRHFDGQLAPIACVSSTHYEACSQECTAGFAAFCWTSATTRPDAWTRRHWRLSSPRPR